MNLTPLRNDLFYPLEQVFDKFYQDFFHNKAAINTAKSAQSYPKMNVYQDENAFKIVFAVPGTTDDDLEIEYKNDNTVTLRGKMSQQYHADNNAVFYVRELRQSSFERTIILPESVNGEPEAELKDGLLTLHWKLKPPKDETIKKISVKKL